MEVLNMRLLCALCVCGVNQAKELDVPELGVKFTNVPDQTSVPRMGERKTGSEVSVAFGGALIYVFRADDAVPDETDTTTDIFRDALVARRDNPIRRRSNGHRAEIAGHAGWAFINVEQTAPGLAQYTCIVFLVVDHHLLRLTALAQSAAQASHAEYDEAVRALDSIRFVPPQGVAVAPTSWMDLGVHLKRFNARAAGDVYPPLARRLHEEGPADVEFGISASGHSVAPRVLYAASPQTCPSTREEPLFAGADIEQLCATFVGPAGSTR